MARATLTPPANQPISQPAVRHRMEFNILMSEGNRACLCPPAFVVDAPRPTLSVVERIPHLVVAPLAIEWGLASHSLF